MPTILIVEDDPSIRTAMTDLLSGMGYDTLVAADGKAGLELALERNYNLLLLDLVLPYKSGFEILEQLQKKRPGQAIIILSAKGEEADRIKGLNLGADDYVVKPFSVKELLARIDAVLRRSYERNPSNNNLSLQDTHIDFSASTITHSNGTQHPLSEKEAELLKYLYINKGRPVAKEELLKKVWHINPQLTDSRTVEMHIAKLRKKLACAESIKTIRGSGYRLYQTQSKNEN